MFFSLMAMHCTVYCLEQNGGLVNLNQRRLCTAKRKGITFRFLRQTLLFPPMLVVPAMIPLSLRPVVIFGDVL